MLHNLNIVFQGMTQLFLEIVSPNGKIYSSEVDEIIATTEDGEIAILPNHSPLFTKIVEGEVIIKKGKELIHIALTGGFLEVSANKTQILADYAVKSESINAAKAELAKKKAEELLKNKAENQDFVEIEKDLKKSILELKVSEKVRKRSIV